MGVQMESIAGRRHNRRNSPIGVKVILSEHTRDELLMFILGLVLGINIAVELCQTPFDRIARTIESTARSK